MADYENRITDNEKNGLFVSNPLISSLLYFCQGNGFDPDEILKSTGTNFERIRDVDGKTGEEVYDQIFYQAVQLTKDEHLGLNYGKKFNLQHIGVLGYLMMNCENFGQSLIAYEKFQNSLGESISISHSIRENDVRVTLQLIGGAKSGRHRVESFLSSFVVSGFQLTGKSLKLKACENLFGAFGNSEIYVESIGCVPVQGSKTIFTFDKSYLSNLVINSMPDLLNYFEQGLLANRQKNGENEFSRKVRKEILKRIGKEQIEDLKSISTILGLSERTLQLRLEAEGLKFRDLLEDCQLDFASRFLIAGGSISEISYALGFSEPSAFQRAFKRWSGQSPAQFRSSL